MKFYGWRTELVDKYCSDIRFGDIVELELGDGEKRQFEVQYKTCIRTIKSHPDFDEQFSKVAITGVVFSWNGYDLFPCIDKNGISDSSKMEIVKRYFERED